MSRYTFLLPAYKGQFLSEALLSIKQQTYTDFVCIVSDDCSPEDLKSIFGKTVGDDPRFSYRRNEVNMGSKSLVAHWNMLVDMCETEFFIMASDDDVYMPNYLDEIDLQTIAHPDVDLFRGGVKYIDANNTLLRKDILTTCFQDQLHFLFLYFSEAWMSCEASFCYRTSEFLRKGKYYELPLAWFSDDIAHIRMSQRGCVSTPDIVFTYRKSKIAISGNRDTSTSAMKKLLATSKYCDWLESNISEIQNSEEADLRPKVLSLIYGKINLNVRVFSRLCHSLNFCWLYSSFHKRTNLSFVKALYYWLRAKIGK